MLRVILTGAQTQKNVKNCFAINRKSKERTFFISKALRSRDNVSLFSSNSVLAYALMTACFTSAPSVLLGVMSPSSLISLSQIETTSWRSPETTRPPGRNVSRIRKCTRISGAARIDKSRRVLRNFGELSIPRNDTCLEGTADDYFAKSEKK